MGAAAGVRAPRLAISCVISGARVVLDGVTGRWATRPTGLATGAIQTSLSPHPGNPARLRGRAVTGSEDTQGALAGQENRRARRCQPRRASGDGCLFRSRSDVDSRGGRRVLAGRLRSGGRGSRRSRSGDALALSLTFALGIGLYTGERSGDGPSLRAQFGSEASAATALAEGRPRTLRGEAPTAIEEVRGSPPR
jgi:hypothetical protein